MIVNYYTPKDYISAAEIEEAGLIFGLDEGVISNIKESIKDSILKAISNMGNKFGIRLVDSNVAKQASAVEKEYKTHGFSAKLFQPVQTMMRPLAIQISQSRVFQKKLLAKGFNGEFDDETVINSIMLVGMCFIVNSLVAAMLGYMITVTICAPIVEETAKKIAADNDFIYEYNLIFNTFEFSLYMIQYAGAIPLPALIVARLLAVGMHSFNSLIHYIASNKEILERLGIDASDPDKLEKCSVIGNIITIIIHALWNCMAVFVG